MRLLYSQKQHSHESDEWQYLGATVESSATVTIATSKSQVSAIHNQLGENVGISVEPCRRDTFPAIALAAAYLKDVQHVGEVCDVASSAYLPHSGKSRLGCEAGAVMKFVFIPFVYCWRAGSC